MLCSIPLRLAVPHLLQSVRWRNRSNLCGGGRRRQEAEWVLIVVVLTYLIIEINADLLSEAFSVDNSGTGFLIFVFGDPHGLKGREGAEDGATDPDQELPFCGCDDLDFHGGGSQGSHFLAETLGDAGIHGGSTAHDDIAIKILPDVDVALEDGLVGDFMEAGHLFSDQHGLEEGLGASEPLGGHIDDLTVRKLVGFVVGSRTVVS
jgi:hypothetical protein